MISHCKNYLENTYGLISRNLSEYACIRKNGMKFEISSFTITGIGNMSVLTMSAMLGLMKMETVIITPLEIDAPLFSYDRIRVMGSDTLLLELYDTQLTPFDDASLIKIKNQYKALPPYETGEHWYDPLKLSSCIAKKGKHVDESYQALCHSYADEYFRLIKNAPVCNRTEKQKKVKTYVDGLLTQGGPSTDQFKKMIGTEKTTELFSRFIFASEN